MASSWGESRTDAPQLQRESVCGHFHVDPLALRTVLRLTCHLLLWANQVVTEVWDLRMEAGGMGHWVNDRRADWDCEYQAAPWRN